MSIEKCQNIPRYEYSGHIDVTPPLWTEYNVRLDAVQQIFEEFFKKLNGNPSLHTYIFSKTPAVLDCTD